MMECPKPANRSQPLVGLSSPYCKDIWRRYFCTTSFFRLLIRALVAKKARQSCTMVRRWRLFGDFLRPAFTTSRVVSDLHPKFALRPQHVWKYGIHLTSDREEKRKKKNKQQDENIYGLPYYIGRP